MDEVLGLIVAGVIVVFLVTAGYLAGAADIKNSCKNSHPIVVDHKVYYCKQEEKK